MEIGHSRDPYTPGIEIVEYFFATCAIHVITCNGLTGLYSGLETLE